MNHPVCAGQAEAVFAKGIVDEGERVETKERRENSQNVNHGLQSNFSQLIHFTKIEFKIRAYPRLGFNGGMNQIDKQTG
jgi:hypothetical protein